MFTSEKGNGCNISILGKATYEEQPHDILTVLNILNISNINYALSILNINIKYSIFMIVFTRHFINEYFCLL